MPPPLSGKGRGREGKARGGKGWEREGEGEGARRRFEASGPGGTVIRLWLDGRTDVYVILYSV